MLHFLQEQELAESRRTTRAVCPVSRLGVCRDSAPDTAICQEVSVPATDADVG